MWSDKGTVEYKKLSDREGKLNKMIIRRLHHTDGTETHHTPPIYHQERKDGTDKRKRIRRVEGKPYYVVKKFFNENNEYMLVIKYEFSLFLYTDSVLRKIKQIKYVESF